MGIAVGRLLGIEEDAPPGAEGLPRLAALLPHGRHDGSSLLFSLAPPGCAECVGFCLETVPQTGADDSMSALLENLVSALPSGACLQVSLFADPRISPHLDRYERLRAGGAGGIHPGLAARRRALLEAPPGPSGPPAGLLRDFRLFVSVTVPGSLSDPTVADGALRLRQSVRGTLHSAHFPARDLDDATLADTLGAILRPGGPRVTSVAHGCDVRGAVPLRGALYEVADDHVRAIDGGTTTCLVAMAVCSYPREARLQGMGGIVGDFLHESLAYESPFLVTMALRTLDREQARQSSELRTARAVQNASSVMARLMPGHYEQRRDDWSLVSAVLKNGGTLVHLSHQAVLLAAPGRAVAAAEAARAVWRARGFDLACARHTQLQALLASLPLGLTPALADDLRRAGWMRQMTHHNAVRTAPMLAEWKGSRTPVLLLFGRRGQIMPLDFFDNDSGNHNVIVAGASGTGKSVLLNEVAVSYLSTGAQVWIIDVGRSYENTCRLLGGEFLEFGRGPGGACLNPFASVNNIDADMELLDPLFALMISPGRPLSDYQRSKLQAAIRRAWDDRGSGATPSDLREALLSDADVSDPRVRDMAVMLQPYTEGGVHGHMFAHGSAEFGSALTVVELEELKSRKELQAIVLFIMMYRISQAMYHERGRRKMVIVDEVWDLMRSPASADFIEHGYRRARKYNGAFLSAAQSVADFHANASALAALENSDWGILLRQKPERVGQLTGDGRLALDEGERRMLLSLRTRQGQFSEMLVRSEQGSGVGRLVIDPFARLLYSSDPADYREIRERMAQGRDITAAIEETLAARQ